MGAHEQFRRMPFDHDRFAESNRDMVERMQRDGLFLVYDDQLDTLFVDIGPHVDGVLEPLTDNIWARVDPGDLRLLGYEIEDFRDDFLPNNRIANALIDELHLFQRPNQRIDASESAQEETLRRLIAV